MTGELLIAAGPGEWRAAWVEAGAAVELYVERRDTKPAGSIHLGRVVRLVPGLEALLVDIGDARPALLALRHAAEAPRDEGARIVVQVRREASADKAPLVTAKIETSDRPTLAERANRLDPPAQLFPAPGFAAALGLRLPARPQRIVADDLAIVPELRAAFPGVAVEQQSAPDQAVDLDGAFAAALSATLALRHGGRVHFEQSRAAVLVDVDTGMAEAQSAERAALAANRDAAGLIAGQMRLRNLSGSIVVDFVGLDRRGARDRVRQAMESALAGDPAKPQVLGWTRLGHLEMVRPRRARSLADALLEPPGGQPPAKLALTLAYEALRGVQREARATPAANWRLDVPARVEAALRGPAAAALHALETRLGRRIAIAGAAVGDGFDIVRV